MATKRTRLAELGRRIFRAREVRGWTQEQLGEAVGKSSMTVSRYERGAMEPGALTACDLAEALQVGGNYLLGLTAE